MVEPRVTAQGPRAAQVMYYGAALGTTMGDCLEECLAGRHGFVRGKAQGLHVPRSLYEITSGDYLGQNLRLRLRAKGQGSSWNVLWGFLGDGHG